MITNAVTHYQTCFKAFEKNDAYKPLSTIQNIVYGWLLMKEKDPLCRNAKKDFFKRCNWGNLSATHSSVGTNTVYTDNFKGWALRYTHRDRELDRGRRWYVDIGVKEEDAVATFYCRVYYARNQFDTSLEHPIPPTNTPLFIRDIVAEKSGLNIYSREKEFGLYDRPVPVTIGYGKHLADWIQSRERRYAMIVFNPDSDALKREAKFLAYKLAGKSQVLVLDDDPELAEELRHYLHRELSIHRGKYRVFYPMNPAFPRPNRHRWFDPLDPDYLTQRQGLVSSLLRVYQLEEPLAITNISDVGRMRSMEALRKRLSDSLVRSQDLKEFEEILNFSEQEFEEKQKALKQELEYYMSEYEEKESEVWRLQSRVYALESSTPHKRHEGDELLLELKHRVENLPEMVDMFSRIFKDRLHFAEEAYKSAKDFAHCPVLDRAFDLLYHVGTTLFNLKFEEDKPGDIATRFQAISGFEFAMSEGKQSKKDNSIRASRRISVNGKQYEIWPHIKLGNKPPKILRVYFAFDDDLKKIVIGHVGKHLKNATTRSMK